MKRKNNNENLSISLGDVSVAYNGGKRPPYWFVITILIIASVKHLPSIIDSIANLILVIKA